MLAQTPMRLVLVGTVAGSKVALEALAADGHCPAAVVTLPPEAAARHSDYADLAGPAAALGARTIFTRNINAPETIGAIAEMKSDLCLVIGWSQICRDEFRRCARIGSIGFHPAPLPRLRGRAVIPWTILLNEQQSGSTLFWLDDGINSGPILLQRLFPVDPDETAATLYAKHTANLGAMLPEAVKLVAAGTPPRRAQDNALATYGARRTAEDGLIDWSLSADAILRLVRAVGPPYPGAFTTDRGERLAIIEASKFPESARYVGVQGQVQVAMKDGFVVRCGDGECIHVHAWQSQSGRVPVVHSKLGKS